MNDTNAEILNIHLKKLCLLTDTQNTLKQIEIFEVNASRKLQEFFIASDGKEKEYARKSLEKAKRIADKSIEALHTSVSSPSKKKILELRELLAKCPYCNGNDPSCNLCAPLKEKFKKLLENT